MWYLHDSQAKDMWKSSNRVELLANTVKDFDMKAGGESVIRETYRMLNSIPGNGMNTWAIQEKIQNLSTRPKITKIPDVF